jgi:hypothetical protein
VAGGWRIGEVGSGDNPNWRGDGRSRVSSRQHRGATEGIDHQRELGVVALATLDVLFRRERPPQHRGVLSCEPMQLVRAPPPA